MPPDETQQGQPAQPGKIDNLLTNQSDALDALEIAVTTLDRKSRAVRVERDSPPCDASSVPTEEVSPVADSIRSGNDRIALLVIRVEKITGEIEL